MRLKRKAKHRLSLASLLSHGLGTQAARSCNKTERREAQKGDGSAPSPFHPAESRDTLDGAPERLADRRPHLSAIRGTTDVAERLQPVYITQSEEGVGIWKSHRLH